MGDVFALVLHLQGFAVVALAVAHIAGHIHIGQKVHFHLDHAVALAGFAATPALGGSDVERKPPRPVTALARHRHLGHQLANGGEQAGVGGGVGARCAANRRLVDIDDLVEQIQASDVVVGRGFGVGAVDAARRSGVQGVVDQGGLARTRHTGDASEQAHRDVHRHLLQVVGARPVHAQHRCRLGGGCVDAATEGVRGPLFAHKRSALAGDFDAQAA